MNFQLPPRPQNHYQNHGRNYRRNPTWGMGSGYHAVDKARYVHANYRFIVDPRGDYHAQTVDADVHLDWNKVLQILVSSESQGASCPICLSTPVAPRMPKCGHITCLSCLIRYMHSEEEGRHPHEKRPRWKKCPFCSDSIYISDCRPVRWYAGQEGPPPREGGDVVLRLVTRASGSTIALPRDGADSLAKDENIPWYLAAEVMDFARVMKGSEDYMTEQYDREIQELEIQEKEDELMYGDDTQWTKKAIRSIQEAKEKLHGIGNPPAMPEKPTEPKIKRTPILFNENDDVPEMYNIQHASRSGQSMPDGYSTPQTEVLNSDPAPTDSNSNTTKPDDRRSYEDPLKTPLSQFKSRHRHEHGTPSEYFFYHALLHYYLSPLDIRILKSAFGNFASFPSTILPRVEHVSTGHIVDDELRRRTKYLAHLPYGCEVSFLECDWTDTVPPEILERFKPEIERRRKRHHEKESREEKARVRAERMGDEFRWAAARRKRPESTDKFSADDFAPLVSSDAGASVDGDSTQASTSPPYVPSRQGSAFASLASPSTSPSTSRTVWGTTAIAPSSPGLAPIPQELPPDDGWLQGWEQDLLSGEDQMLAQAKELSLGQVGESSKAGAQSASGGGGGGKKKKKKITLMSTNVRRGA